MEKKSTKYLLIGLVTLIWGLIIYRVVDGMSAGSTAPISVSSPQVIHQVATVDTFSLMANYPDPFLDQSDSLIEETVEPDPGRTKGISQSAGQRPMNVSVPVAFNANDLKYIGYIGNSNTRKRTGIVSYKGTEYMVRETDKVDLWKVVAITSKSIIVRADGQSYTINLEN